LVSWLTSMLTKVSYHQDGSNTSFVGPQTSRPKHPLCIHIHDPMISVSWKHNRTGIKYIICYSTE
jgi:hypothetical protein